MFPPGPPPPLLPGGAVSAERKDLGGSMAAGGGDAADGSGYEYEVKRQRLLQGGSTAASGMLASYYPSQPPQPQQNVAPFSSSAAALQSSIAASLNSYFAAASSTPSGAQQHGTTLPAASDMHSSYYQHPAPVPPAAVVPSNSGLNAPTHLSNPPVNPNYMSNSAPNYMNSSGAEATYLTSGTHPNTANMNPSFTSNSGRGFNPTTNASHPSASQIPPYPSTGAPVLPSSSFSPFRTASPPGLAGPPHPPLSPPPAPKPMMPYDRRSPQMPHSPPLVPPPFFQGPGFGRYPSFACFFPVVRMRGLPFNCTESDIYEFFRGLDVVDVLLTHKQGRFSGEAYCVFGLPMQVELALHRNRQSMGQRYVEVFRSKKHEYYMAVAAEVSESGTGEERTPSFPSSKPSIEKEHLEHTGVLKLRGIPFSSSKKDVIEFFKDFDLKDENIQFVVHSDGRATGEAYVEFEGPSQSKQAMSRDKMMLGSRYIELFPSSSEEAAKATGRYKK